MRRHILKAHARSRPGRATSDQTADFTVLLDRQTDEIVVERPRCSPTGPDKDDTGRLAGEGSGGRSRLRSSRNEAGRAEIARQTLDSEHQALRFGYTPRSAVEE